jgi:hypothetical protein
VGCLGGVHACLLEPGLGTVEVLRRETLVSFYFNRAGQGVRGGTGHFSALSQRIFRILFLALVALRESPFIRLEAHGVRGGASLPFEVLASQLFVLNLDAQKLVGHTFERPRNAFAHGRVILRGQHRVVGDLFQFGDYASSSFRAIAVYDCFIKGRSIRVHRHLFVGHGLILWGLKLPLLNILLAIHIENRVIIHLRIH